MAATSEMATSNAANNVPTNEVIVPVETDCSICSDRYTAIIRKCITCKYCKKGTCSKCIEQYLLTRGEDAHCIHCRVHYNDKDLQSICTKTYLKDRYFKHRQEILISRERANLPGLQDAAHQEKARKDRMKQIAVLTEEIKDLTTARNGLRMDYVRLQIAQHDHPTPLEQESTLQRLSDDMHTYVATITMKKQQMFDLRVQPFHPEAAGAAVEEKKEEERRKFIRRCMRANCNGYLSTAWKCGLCEWYSCSKCFTEKGQNHDSPHECKKEDIETADLIRSDSKPCPNCGEFINKSSGCDQMYCVSCQTPFSWTTLKIVTSGVIHNPHYYEMMKRKGALPRNPGDVPCGGFPNRWQLIAHPRKVRSFIGDYYLEFHRLCQEVQDVSQRTYRAHIDNTTTHEINIKYLLGELNDVKWGRLLATNEKKRKRDTEIQEVFAAFLMVAVNIINTVQNYHDEIYPDFTSLPAAQAEQILLDLHVEITELITIMNEAFKGISQSYSYTVPIIDTIVCDSHKIIYRLTTKSFTTKSKKRNDADFISDDSDKE